MPRIALFLVLLLLVGCASPQLRPVSLPKVNVLPLALSDDFEFRKTILYLYGDKQDSPGTNEMLRARQKKVAYGAIDYADFLARKGNYFTFFWRAHRDADLAVRLEYRTANLGDYVQAREITYHDAKGSHKTQFAVVGDDYLDDGRVTAWRALLIENGRIVAMTQSFLWN